MAGHAERRPDRDVPLRCQRESLERTTPSGTRIATYDAQDRLLTYGNLTYTYDANGSLQSKTDTSTGQVTSYVYDGQGNLRHVDLPDGRTLDYIIDSENRRVAKKINGAVVRKWIYEDQLKPVAEFDGAGTLLARYLDGVTVKGSTSYRVVVDHLGTPRLLVGGTAGTVGQRLDLDEWGQVTADSSAGFQVFGFAGGIYDADTGLVRFGARDYDPASGRWMAKDPIRFRSGESSLYRYVNDDPVNATDGTGLQAGADAIQGIRGVPAVGPIIAAGVLLICQAIDEAVSPRDCYEECEPYMQGGMTYRSLRDGRECRNDFGRNNTRYAYYCCLDDCTGKPPRRLD
jgi:RHS repeat-associated protein